MDRSVPISIFRSFRGEDFFHLGSKSPIARPSHPLFMQYRTVIILSSARFNSRKISFIAAARCIMRSTREACGGGGGEAAIFDRIGVTETGDKGKSDSNFTHAIIPAGIIPWRDTPFISNGSTLMHHWTTLHRRRRQPRYSYGRPLAPASLYFYFHVPWINYRGLLSATLRAPVTDSHRLFIRVSRSIVPRYRCPTIVGETLAHRSPGNTFLDEMAMGTQCSYSSCSAFLFHDKHRLNGFEIR